MFLFFKLLRAQRIFVRSLGRLVLEKPNAAESRSESHLKIIQKSADQGHL